jgi:hypothetical protein
MSRWRLRTFAAVAILSLLPGCGLNGDLGRARPSQAQELLQDWIELGAARRSGDAPGQIQLTDDERVLRDLAYPLLEPPYERNQFYSVIAEIGFVTRRQQYPNREAYSSHLFGTPYRSQTARYNKLIEDIRNDVVHLDPFFRAAHHVADMDLKRAKSLAYVSKVTAKDRSNAVRRIAENKAILRWVQESLHERAASYQIALERLVIAAPSPNAIEAERSLTLLRQRIGHQAAGHERQHLVSK